MSAPIVELQGVSLRYRLAKHRIPSLKEYAIHWLKGSLTYEQLWALRNVSVTIEAGEWVSVIGRNGAGKSTLLKVIARVLKPTRGHVEVRGSLIPVLELGTGFDFELTGLENVYLNALLLGRRRREIEARVDGIIDFSGLQDFIYSPIRNYSSGMLARLAFSIATAWVPDVLLLDEVLAVGDLAFKKRCGERLERLRAEGTTILNVTHSTVDIPSTCSRCLLLHQGRLVGDGEPTEIVDQYVGALSSAEMPLRTDVVTKQPTEAL